MQAIPLLGAAALLAAAAGVFALTAASPGDAPTTPPPAGHDVLVVEGDRDQLAITHARHKAAPWAGAPKGFRSRWSLSIRDAAGKELVAVPLDMSAFDLDPARKGQQLQVQGCVVRDPQVAMIVNAPTLPDAASYVFLRDDVVVGAAAATTVAQLAGGGR